MKKVIAGMAAMLLFTQAPTEALAQNESCPISKFKSESSGSNTTTLNVHYLRLIDKRSYQEAQKQGSLKTLFSIAPTFLKSNANYESFDAKRNAYFEKIKYDYDFSSASNYASSILDDNGLKAYQDCLENNSGENFFVHTDEITDDYVDLTLRWRKRFEGPEIIDLQAYVEGGTFLRPFPEKIVHGQDLSVRIERKPNTQLFLKVSSSKHSDVVKKYEKQFSYPSDLMVFWVRFWADKIEFEEASTIYFDEIWTVDKSTVLQSGGYELLYTASHAGPLLVHMEVAKNKKYRINIDRPRAHESTRILMRSSGWGNARMQKCSGQPCGYYAASRLLSK